MKTNEQKNSRKRLNSLILLVAFTAIMLIVSTYAWFSTQKNVQITGLTGDVKVAEGMQISLDAKTWTSTIDLSSLDIVTDAYNSVTGTDKNTYTNSNLKVDEMQPVSTLGTDRSAAEMKLYRGINTDVVKLSNIVEVNPTVTRPTEANYPGYFAFDVFIQNSGLSSGETEGTTVESLQLDANSTVTVKASGGNSSTGLQNTPRVAFAKYSGTAPITGTDAAVADDARILPLTNAATSTISDIAIWEPNCEKHVANIVAANNYIIWSNDDKKAYNITAETNQSTGVTPFADNQTLPTYALAASAAAASAKDTEEKKFVINNIYDWSGADKTPVQQGYLAKQKVVATTSTNDKVNYLKSTTDGTTDFEILKNTVTKIRIYIWLEGQDVDTTNYASHGGGITVNIGLVKGTTEASLLGNTSSPTANNSAHATP